MKRIHIQRTLLFLFLIVAVLIVSLPAAAQNAATAYPKMAPIEQYLMDRNAEIALARTAAPETVSRDAEVLVLGRNGFETAVKGKTVSYVSWGVDGHRRRILTFGIRKCGFQCV